MDAEQLLNVFAVSSLRRSFDQTFLDESFLQVDSDLAIAGDLSGTLSQQHTDPLHLQKAFFKEALGEISTNFLFLQSI